VSIQKELEALALFVESKRITSEVADYRNNVMDRTNCNRNVSLLLAGEFLANAATLIAVCDGDAKAVMYLREFADNIENNLIKKS
jgi:hypothetical protein